MPNITELLTTVCGNRFHAVKPAVEKDFKVKSEKRKCFTKQKSFDCSKTERIDL